MNVGKATGCQKSGLRAVVFIPSQRIGFVKIGQRVRISYDAFQQHRFGKHSGTIRALSLTPMDPALLPQGRKAGLYAGMSAEEPLYRADIDLDAQVISIDHEARPLIPGMSLTVDLVLERRSIFEAIFEPILRLHRRMGYCHECCSPVRHLCRSDRGTLRLGRRQPVLSVSSPACQRRD
ncbi:hypothetical protein [Massilia sp. TWP1-3-3]|uniref:hypothetical protein n=1 Tax=Massilia sp. TWP1-3-3 TaxID=2804573 RepID=UPI003CEA1EC5